MVNALDGSKDHAAKVNETSKVSKVTVSQSLTRQSQTRSSASM